MAISRDEILKVAALSKLSVDDDEIARVTKQLTDVLNYATLVCQYQGSIANIDYRAQNVVRRDEPFLSNAQVLLAQAPASQEHLFVVPKIVNLGKEGA